MAIPASDPDELDVLIPLRGGATVRYAVLLWLLDCEDRGITFSTEADGRARLHPGRLVTDADLAFARAHRDEVRAAVAYIERMCEAPL